MITERRVALLHLAAVTAYGAVAEVPLTAGPHPTVDAAGRVDYGRPVSRVTWRRDLPPAAIPATVTLPPRRRQSAHLHG